ncbi:MAG: M48 family metallopeptidase [Burkholderiaceae bacterium]|nr:M48 family metallopeptidase [Burkholderiaceae bacterium]
MSNDPDAPERKIAASYYDGRSSEPFLVELEVDRTGVTLLGAVRRKYEWTGTRLSEPLQHAPRLIRFADGSHCEIVDHAGLDAALQATGYRDSWVVRSQRRWSHVAVATVLLIAAILALYRWGLPAAAEYAARRVPPAVESRIGVQAVKIVEQRFGPSKLPPAQRDRVQRVFDSIVPHDGRNFRLLLRDGGPIGANAFALPGGTVLVTDQLAELATDDAALAGVLAHEIGHVEKRHVLRQIISSSVVGVVIAMIAGDVSSVTVALPAALAQLSYSRDMEREADAYAVELLQQHSIPVEPFADLLQRLQKDSGGGADGWGRYLTTHPATEQRVAAIRQAAHLR